MVDKCKQENQCIETQYKNKISHIHYKWFIFCLIELIVALLTFKFWGKPAPLENLISIGSGLISIVLGVFAIIYSVSESIKTNNKENKVDSMLDKIEKNIINMNDIVTDISKVTNSSFNELTNLKRTNDKIEESISKFNYEKFNEQANEKVDKVVKIENNDLNSQVTIRKPVNKFNMVKISKGDLYVANLGEKNTSILGGTRPVIIVQNNISNKYAPSLTVVPVTTSKSNDNNFPTHVTFDWKNQVNIAAVEQVTTISKSDIIDFIDELDDEVLNKINKALLIQLGIQE